MQLKNLNYWKQTGNSKIIEKIKQLIFAIQIDPFRGIGKPEPLKHNYSGMWSRRITREHRIIYKIEANKIVVIALKEHYRFD